MFLLYDMTTFGFVPETYRAMALGIYKVKLLYCKVLFVRRNMLSRTIFFQQSIVRAHESLQEGRLYIGETEVLDASINRSPTSYLNNPEEERAQYV